MSTLLNSGAPSSTARTAAFTDARPIALRRAQLAGRGRQNVRCSAEKQNDQVRSPGICSYRVRYVPVAAGRLLMQRYMLRCRQVASAMPFKDYCAEHTSPLSPFVQDRHSLHLVPMI